MYVVDASVYVSRINSHEQDHEASKRFIGEVCVEQLAVFCPEILLPEVSASLAGGLDDAGLAEQSAQAIRTLPGHRFVAVDRQLADSAVEVAATCRLRGMDAIYVALALRENARLVTLDKKQLERTHASVVTVRPQDELEALGRHSAPTSSAG